MQVSVIIPTYNRAHLLQDAFSSVLSQSFKDFELIVVDDGSTDSTHEVLKGFADSRIQVVKTENRGVSSARNTGIKKSTGELIAFLDSDDIWLPKKLDVQVEYFKNRPDVMIAQTEEIWKKNGKRIFPKSKHKKKSGWIFKDSLLLCLVSPSAVMMRREFFDRVGLFDEELLSAEDYDLWLRASLHYEIYTIDNPLIIKRGGHADQLSARWGLDLWRARSLTNLLKNPFLLDVYRIIVTEEIIRRSNIFLDGALKRGCNYSGGASFPNFLSRGMPA